MASPQTDRRPRGGQGRPISLGDGDSLKQASRSTPQGPRLPTGCRGAWASAPAMAPHRVRPPTPAPPAHLPLPHTCPARTPGRSPAPLRPLFLPRRMDTVILGDNVAVQPRRRPGPPGRNEAHGHSTRTLPPATAVQAASGIKSLWRGSEWLRYVRLGLGGRSRHQFTKCLLELVKPFHLLTPEKMLIAAT